MKGKKFLLLGLLSCSLTLFSCKVLTSVSSSGEASIPPISISEVEVSDTASIGASTSLSSSIDVVSSSSEEHVHTYSNDWSSDASYHWHEATCEHTSEVKDKAAHTFSDVVTAATYSAGGYTTHTCTVCGYSYVDNRTDPLEHNYERGWHHDENNHWHACTDEGYENLKSGEAAHTFRDVVTPATYEAGGYTTHTCVFCGYSYVDSRTDQLVHNYESGWHHDDTNHWHACTDDGYGELKDGEAAHSWNEGVVTTPATSESEGVKTYTCTVCGHTKTETINRIETISSIAGHTFVGADIQETDYYYYQEMKEVALTQHYTFNADGTMIGVADKAIAIINDVASVNEFHNEMNGRYTQVDDAVTLLITGIYDPQSGWTSIPEQYQTPVHGVLQNNNLIIESSGPDENKQSVTIHFILTLQD